MSLFNSITPQQVSALARLGTPEMAPVVELLSTTVIRLQEQLVKAETPNVMFRLQGELTVLNDLLLGIKKAPEVLSRLG